jgi:hypothetical protein
MKVLVFVASAALALALPIGQAEAWYRGGFGGGFRTAGGGFVHAGDAGGFAHGTYVGPAGVYHGSTYGGFYHGTYANGAGAWHTGAYGAYYHQPAVVNSYGGCWNCGYHGWGYAGAAAAGAVAGAAVGAAAAGWALGATYGYLPSGCTYTNTAGAAYYQCPSGWLRPAYGANGVYYTVVPAP